MKSQRNLQAQLKTAQLVPTFREADTRPKFLIELAKPTKKMLLKNFKRFKKMVLHWNRRICKNLFFNSKGLNKSQNSWSHQSSYSWFFLIFLGFGPGSPRPCLGWVAIII
jgi:hypothetical protein